MELTIYTFLNITFPLFGEKEKICHSSNLGTNWIVVIIFFTVRHSWAFPFLPNYDQNLELPTSRIDRMAFNEQRSKEKLSLFPQDRKWITQKVQKKSNEEWVISIISKRTRCLPTKKFFIYFLLRTFSTILSGQRRKDTLPPNITIKFFSPSL